jgi:hypothetical protein
VNAGRHIDGLRIRPPGMINLISVILIAILIACRFHYRQYIKLTTFDPRKKSRS